MLGMLARTVVFVLPLGRDILTVSTALGTLGLAGWARWRVSVVLASCQVATMLIGLVLGAELAQAIGEPAGYVGAGVFIALGDLPTAGATPARPNWSASASARTCLGSSELASPSARTSSPLDSVWARNW